MRDYKAFTLTENQLKVALSLAEAELDQAEHQSTAFALVKAIVSRRFVVPELYDLMERMCQLLVQSQSKTARQAAREIFLAYMLDYPLGTKRLRKHVNFLVANLCYEHASGRESVLEILQQALFKFPPQIVHEFAQLIFLPLVTQLVNDDSASSRRLVGGTLQTLLKHTDAATHDKMQHMVAAWLKNDDWPLRRAAFQIAGHFVQALGSSYSRHVAAVRRALVAELDRVASIPNSELAAPAGGGEDGGESDSEAVNGGAAAAGGAGDVLAVAWEQAYISMTTLEKILRTFPAELKGSVTPAADGEPCVWEAITVGFAGEGMLWWLEKGSLHILFATCRHCSCFHTAGCGLRHLGCLGCTLRHGRPWTS